MNSLNDTEIRAYAARHYIDEDAARTYVAGRELARQAQKFAGEHDVPYSRALDIVLGDPENAALKLEYGRAV